MSAEDETQQAEYDEAGPGGPGAPTPLSSLEVRLLYIAAGNLDHFITILLKRCGCQNFVANLSLGVYIGYGWTHAARYQAARGRGIQYRGVGGVYVGLISSAGVSGMNC